MDFLSKFAAFENPTPQKITKRITANISETQAESFYNKHRSSTHRIIPRGVIDNISEHYSTFKIPKKTGGMREICAPDETLKYLQYNLLNYFQNNLHILEHDAAFAYVPKKSTVKAVTKHQNNKSKWFLKIDLKDFFPSHNKAYIIRQLEKVYPTGVLLKKEGYKEALSEALDLCLLNDSLPQGTPISPYLTNICMVPVDYKIEHMLWNLKSNFTYTRYADDMIISSPYKFDYQMVLKEVQRIFDEEKCPFRINKDKVHFGSSSGRNWILGIMLNKDNRKTIGHKKNQKLRAAIFQLCSDYINKPDEFYFLWPYQRRAQLSGLISYYKSIDPEYTKLIIGRYQRKFHVNIKPLLAN